MVTGEINLYITRGKLGKQKVIPRCRFSTWPFGKARMIRSNSYESLTGLCIPRNYSTFHHLFSK